MSSSSVAGSTGTGNGRPNSFAGVAPSASLHHQSPGRDRVNPPNLPPHWYPFSHDPRRSLTPIFARQFPPGNPRSYNNNNNNTSNNNPDNTSHHPFVGRPMAPPMVEVEPMGLPPMSSPGFIPPALLHHPGPHEQAYPGHPNGASGISPFEPAMPGPPYSRMPNFYHEGSLVHPPDGSGYSTGPNTSGYPASSREFW